MSDKVRAWVWELDLPPARKLVMLWLAGRATDNGVAFPGEREIRDKTGLGERMVRYHLQGLAEGEADKPRTKPEPLLLRIERRVRAGRNTSNVCILRVPWAGWSRMVAHQLSEIAAFGALADPGGRHARSPRATAPGARPVPMLTAVQNRYLAYTLLQRSVRQP